MMKDRDLYSTIIEEVEVEHKEEEFDSSYRSPVSTAGAAAAAAPTEFFVPDSCKGLLWVSLSTFLFSVMAVFIHLSGASSVPSFQIMFVRCTFQWFISLGMCKYYDVHPLIPESSTHTKMLVLWRSFIGVAANSCFIYALTCLDMAEATVLFFTAPVWTVMIAFCAFGENMDNINMATILVSFLGVLFVSQPSFMFNDGWHNAKYDPELRFGALIVVIIGSVCAALVFIVLRQLGSAKMHALVVTHAFGLFGMLSSPLMLLLFQQTPYIGTDPLIWSFQVVIGIIAFFAQLTFNHGVMMSGKAGPSSVVRNLDVVFAYFWQIVLFADIPTALSLTGAILILGGVVTIGLRDWLLKQADGGDGNTAGKESQSSVTAIALASMSMGGGKYTVLHEEQKEVEEGLDDEGEEQVGRDDSGGGGGGGAGVEETGVGELDDAYVGVHVHSGTALQGALAFGRA